MGLDMYLEAEFHIRKWERATNSPEVQQFDALLKIFDIDFEGFSKRYPDSDYASVAFQVAYWRKANAIHGWFVDNIQGGKDECQRSYVPRKALEDLHGICNCILATVNKGGAVKERDIFGCEYESYPDLTFDRQLAQELLPTRSGFFFGGTDYDQWYVRDLERTVNQIDAILNDPRLRGADIYYQASW